MARIPSISPFRTPGTPGAGGLTLDALMDRQKQLARNAVQLPAAPEMASPWQGASYLGNVIADVVGQNRAERDTAATRDALAQATSGIDYETGATNEQINQIAQYDPEQAQLLLQQRLDRAKESRAVAQEATINDRERAELIETEKRNRNNFTAVPPEIAAARGIKDPSGFQYNTLTGDVEPIDKSAKNTVTVGGETQSTLDKELGTQTGKLWSGYQAAAANSAGTMQDMEMIKELLPMAPQGPILGDIAKRFPGISSAGAAITSIINRVAPTLRAPGSGATSDIEYEGMLRSLPNLGNMPEANNLIAEMVQRKAQLNIERGRIIDQYMLDHDQAKALQAMNALNSQSIMTPELKALIEKVGPAAAAAGDPEVDAIVKQYGSGG